MWTLEDGVLLPQDRQKGVAVEEFTSFDFHSRHDSVGSRLSRTEPCRGGQLFYFRSVDLINSRNLGSGRKVVEWNCSFCGWGYLLA